MGARRIGRTALIAVALAATVSAFVLPRGWLDERAQSSLAVTADAPAASAAGNFAASAMSTGGLGDWQFLGPNNVGGPANYVGYRPGSSTVLYSVARAGDVFRSDDAGSSWTFLSHLPIRDARLEQVAGQPGTLYAFGTQVQQTRQRDIQIPLLKSTDAGLTWTEMRPVSPQQAGWLYRVNSIRTVPGQPGVLWAGTSYGLMRSLDDGNSWAMVFNMAGSASGCTDLSVSTARSKVVAACQSPAWNVLSANLDGTGWSLLTNRGGDDHTARLAVAKSDDRVMYLVTYGSNGSIYPNVSYMMSVSISRDGGSNWETRYDRAHGSNPVNAAIPGDFEFECAYPGYGATTRETAAVEVDPVNPERLWIAGRETYRSDDAGINFGRVQSRESEFEEPLLGMTSGLMSFMASRSMAFPANYDGAAVQTAFVAGHFGIESTSSAAAAATSPTCGNSAAPGIAWQARNNGFSATRLVHGSMAANGEMVVSGPDLDVGLSDGSGPDAWVRAVKVRDVLVGQTSIDPVAGLDHFQIGWRSGLVDWNWDAVAGKWRARQTNYVDGGNPPGYVLGYENDIFHTWYYPRRVQDPANPDRVVSGSNIGVYESRNRGLNWALISPNVAVESFGIKRDGTIIASTEDGYLLSQVAPNTQTWVKHDLNGCVQGTGTYCPFALVSFTRFYQGPDPADQGLYATAEDWGKAKVWYSADGRSWTPLDRNGQPGGIPDYFGSTVLAIDPDNPAHLYAGTPMGLYVSEDRGQNWELASTPFPDTPVAHLEFRKEANGARRLVAYTYGRGAWVATVAASTAFSDVPTYVWSYDYVRRLYAAGITNGCATAPISYCPQQPVLREQMAAFLLRAIHGGSYQPPSAVGYFADVPSGYWAAGWIEQLRLEGVTNGCATSPALYCPGDVVPREQIAVFLLRAKHGASYQPPAATGMFADVPTDSWAAGWIEQLAREGIANGCATSPARYCPTDPVTREQMAAFLVRTFQL